MAVCTMLSAAACVILFASACVMLSAVNCGLCQYLILFCLLELGEAGTWKPCPLGISILLTEIERGSYREIGNQ